MVKDLTFKIHEFRLANNSITSINPFRAYNKMASSCSYDCSYLPKAIEGNSDISGKGVSRHVYPALLNDQVDILPGSCQFRGDCLYLYCDYGLVLYLRVQPWTWSFPARSQGDTNRDCTCFFAAPWTSYVQTKPGGYIRGQIPLLYIQGTYTAYLSIQTPDYLLLSTRYGKLTRILKLLWKTLTRFLSAVPPHSKRYPTSNRRCSSCERLRIPIVWAFSLSLGSDCVSCVVFSRHAPLDIVISAELSVQSSREAILALFRDVDLSSSTRQCNCSYRYFRILPHREWTQAVFVCNLCIRSSSKQEH